MNTPDILYYARMVNTTTGKTPRYTITEEVGYFPPMEKLRGSDNKISMFLMPQSREDNSGTPPMKLQAKDSLNFTGLKDLWREGKMSGFAYGYPYDKKTYSSKNKPNPCFGYSEHGYLFIFHNKKGNATPDEIEFLVVKDARPLIAAYCKQLEMGGFDDELNYLRQQAKENTC